MRISIAMATYNGTRYLEEQLESFVRQHVRPDELVVCDDGSQDGTIGILEQFAASAPFPVRIHRNPTRLGYGRNFAGAMALSEGALVFLSDQDDVWFPEKIGEVADLAERHPSVQLFLNNAAITDGSLRPSGRTKLGELRKARVSRSSFIQGSCAAVRRELIEVALPLPEACPAHDGWLSEIARVLGGRLIVERELQYYRIHEENTSSFLTNRSEGHALLRKLTARVGRPDQVRVELAAEEGVLEALSDRLGSMEENDVPGLRPGAVAAAASYVSGKREAVAKRRRLYSRGRPGRIVGALKLAWNRDYGLYFNGIHSFIRDMTA